MREVVRVRPLLGTLVAIRAAGAPHSRLIAGVNRAFARVTQVHALMSFHDATSELNTLNREALHRNVLVSPDTIAVLTLAREVYDASNGLFDPAVAPHLVRWGYLPARPVTAGRGTLGDVTLHPNGQVRFERPTQLDLGGIAKGYAVDCAIEALRSAGVPNGSVNAGGDLRVFGGTPTRVHVRDPRDPSVCVPLAEVTDGAIATSATYFSRRRSVDGVLSAIVDPHRATPCRKRSSVSVLASRCAVADALTKVVLLDERRARPILQRFAAAAVVIAAGGRTRTWEHHAA